jgi:hypothetical protein
LVALERELPRLAEQADRAARAYLDGASIAILDDHGLAMDQIHRPGALAHGLASSIQSDTRVILTTGEAPLADLDAAVQVVRLRSDILPGAEAWVFQCELFAACVRQGKVPVVRLSPALDRRGDRDFRYLDQRFHGDRRVEPIPPEELGRAYLHELRRQWRDVGTTSWPALVTAARRAGNTLLDGGRVFVRRGTPALGYVALDPLFTSLDHDGSDRNLPIPGPDDFVIAIGYDQPPRSLEWGEPELLTAAGRGVAWIIAAYDVPQRHRRDLVIDQQWPLGDAAVPVEGYDARLGSTSGVIARALLAALTAQIRVEAQPPARRF